MGSMEETPPCGEGVNSDAVAGTGGILESAITCLHLGKKGELAALLI